MHDTEATLSPRRRRCELRIAPLAVALILLTTAFPVEVRGTARWDASLELHDVVQNFFLYLPLGVALSRRPLWRVALIAGGLSLLIETTQLWQVGRFASPVDLVVNLGGAVVAAALCRRWCSANASTILTIPRSRSIAALAVGLLAIGVGLGTSGRLSAASSLSTWDANYPLLLGNERTPDRPWRGEISELEISVPGASEVPGPHAFSYRSAGAISLDGGAALALPTDVAKRFGEAAVAAQSFTVRLSIATPDTTQAGPARIISFSADTLHRNFDVGQTGPRLVFRVRTPVSGLNGEERRVESMPVLTPGRPVDVVASYDGAVARIHVDGLLAGRSNLAAGACRLPALCDGAAPALWGVSGGVLMVALLLLLPIGKPFGVAVAALGAGLMSIAVARLLPAYPLLVGSTALNPLATFLGAGAVGIAFLTARPTSGS